MGDQGASVVPLPGGLCVSTVWESARDTHQPLGPPQRAICPLVPTVDGKALKVLPAALASSRLCVCMVGVLDLASFEKIRQ